MCPVGFCGDEIEIWGGGKRRGAKLKKRVGEGPGWSVMRDAQNKEWQQQQQQKKITKTKKMQEPTTTEQTRATSSEESNECERMIEELPTRKRSHKGKSERRRTRLRGCVCISKMVPLYGSSLCSVFGGVRSVLCAQPSYWALIFSGDNVFDRVMGRVAK